MKKRWIAVIVSSMLALSLAGCSSEVSDEYITIKKYKKLEIPKLENTEVTDTAVDNMIDSYRSLSQEREEITDRAAEIGDTVDIDYTGTINGQEFDGGSASGVFLVLGSGQFLGAEGDYKGFEEQIVGHDPGDNFDISVKFPADYRNAEVADMPANFNITLNAIYELILPELTDEWVKENSEESETVEEYKKEIRKRIEDSNERQMTNTLQNAALHALLEETEVKKLPEDQVKAEYQMTEDTYKKAAESYGLEFEEFLNTYMNKSLEDFEKDTQENAEFLVKTNLACSLIAKEKKLEPSEDEYQKLIKEYAEDAGYDDVEKFKERMGEDVLRKGILQRKVAEYLVSKSVHVEQSNPEPAGEDGSE